MKKKRFYFITLCWFGIISSLVTMNLMNFVLCMTIKLNWVIVIITFERMRIQSVLSFPLVSWFGHTSLKDKNSSNRLLNGLVDRRVHHSSTQHPCVANSYSRRLTLPSGWRFWAPWGRTKWYRNSFVPAAITEQNKPLPYFAHTYLFIHWSPKCIFTLA